MGENMLKNILLLIVIIAVIIGVCAAVHNIRVAQRNKKELAAFSKDIAYSANLGKVLIVYYSFTGKTEDIAKQISALTKGDLHRLNTQEEFKSSPAFYANVKKQLSDKNYPPLKGEMPDISGYDTVFVGAPVWWYTMATPLFTYLEQTDFKGKKVVPFSTQGSNAGKFLEDFKANAKNAQITKYEKFNNVGKGYDKAVNNKIIAWLNAL